MRHGKVTLTFSYLFPPRLLIQMAFYFYALYYRWRSGIFHIFITHYSITFFCIEQNARWPTPTSYTRTMLHTFEFFFWITVLKSRLFSVRNLCEENPLASSRNVNVWIRHLHWHYNTASYRGVVLPNEKKIEKVSSAWATCCGHWWFTGHWIVGSSLLCTIGSSRDNYS